MPLPGEVPVSSNQRLERVFARNPEYINREFTLPCEVGEPIYQSPLVAANGLEDAIRQQFRVVVTPQTARTIDSQQQEQLKILASPYECGRSLEADEPITIDGIEHTLVTKGIGSTTFARETGAINPWMKDMRITFPLAERLGLRRLAFWHESGVYDRSSVEGALSGYQIAQERGVNSEKILTIVPITAMPDEHGELQSIETFKKSGVLLPDAEPVLFIRAVKSNLRLLDIVMLHQLEKTESLPALLEHIIEQHQHSEGSKTRSPLKTIQTLGLQCIEQELRLILQGYRTNNNKWQDLARNISTLGEVMDLGRILPPSLAIETDREFTGSLEYLVPALADISMYIQSITAQTSGERFDAQEYADTVWELATQLVEQAGVKTMRKRFRKIGHLDGFRADINHSLSKALRGNSLEPQSLNQYFHPYRDRMKKHNADTYAR